MSRVLVIGDTHCPAMLKGYPKFLESIFDAWGCDTVVHIGDLVDWHAISYHAKAVGAPSVMDEVRLAKKQVGELYKRFPVATWLTGNHDALPRRKADDALLPDDILRDGIEYFGLDGWTMVDRFDFHEIDGVLYSHGEVGATGEYAHKNQAKQQQQSIVIGHLHGNAGIEWLVNHRRAVFGMAVGCGVDHKSQAMKYGKKFAKKPVISCGVVIDGEPYVERMRL